MIDADSGRLMMRRSDGLVAALSFSCVCWPAPAGAADALPELPPAAPAAPGSVSEPPSPPPLDTDARPNRARRPFFVGGELGWNGLSGLGVNVSYHPEPHFAIDGGLGLSLTGLRVGARARANFLTSEWTPFAALGVSYANGLGDEPLELEARGEKVQLRLLKSPFVQLAAGMNYTGSEGFVFSATTGYSLLVKKGGNTRFVSGSLDTYRDFQSLYGGGLILAIALGYAF